ncbi:unnamed protein product, partial [marine sediment metagenome]
YSFFTGNELRNQMIMEPTRMTVPIFFKKINALSHIWMITDFTVGIL